MGLFDFFRGKRKYPEDYFIVTITEEYLVVEHPQRKKEYIKQTDIETIKIITTDQGPFQPDVWIALMGQDNGCLIPQGAKGYDEVYDIVSRYDRFNFDSVINAMSSNENQEFLVWTRE